MSNVWMTSDLHLYHNRDFIWRPRGFNSVEEMNSAIVKNWNEVVKADDDIYVLGDLMLNDNNNALRLIKQLKGNIHIIRGNHDTEERMRLYADCHNIVEISEGKFLRIGKYHFYLSHYPCITDNFDIDKPLYTRIINLCGHTHCVNPFSDANKGLIYHVELDAHNMYPVEINKIIDDIKNYITVYS